MRFALALAAGAALWVQPAQAATVISGTFGPGVNQVIFVPPLDPTIIVHIRFSAPVSGGMYYDYAFHEREYRYGVYDGGNDYLGNHPLSFADTKNVTFRDHLPLRSYGQNGWMQETIRDSGSMRLWVDNLQGPVSYTVTISGFGVPEPSTWALMLLGFGAIGAAMRSRPRVTTNVGYS